MYLGDVGPPDLYVSVDGVQQSGGVAFHQQLCGSDLHG